MQLCSDWRKELVGCKLKIHTAFTGKVPLLTDVLLTEKHFGYPLSIQKLTENVNTGRFEQLQEDSCCTYSKAVDAIATDRSYSLHGYFQSWKYFDNVAKQLRQRQL